MIIYHSRTLIHQYLSYDMLKNRYSFDAEMTEKHDRLQKGYSGEISLRTLQRILANTLYNK